MVVQVKISKVVVFILLVILTSCNEASKNKTLNEDEKTIINSKEKDHLDTVIVKTNNIDSLFKTFSDGKLKKEKIDLNWNDEFSNAGLIRSSKKTNSFKKEIKIISGENFDTFIFDKIKVQLDTLKDFITKEKSPMGIADNPILYKVTNEKKTFYVLEFMAQGCVGRACNVSYFLMINDAKVVLLSSFFGFNDKLNHFKMTGDTLLDFLKIAETASSSDSIYSYNLDIYEYRGNSFQKKNNLGSYKIHEDYEGKYIELIYKKVVDSR